MFKHGSLRLTMGINIFHPHPYKMNSKFYKDTEFEWIFQVATYKEIQHS